MIVLTATDCAGVARHLKRVMPEGHDDGIWIAAMVDRLEHAACRTPEPRPDLNDDDGRRPHRFPRPADTPNEILSRKCQACGEWINENATTATPCPIDWRHP